MLHLSGLTETSPIATALVRDEEVLDSDRVRSCGGVELRIAGEDGHIVGPRHLGEVQLRGPNVMAGYWNKPADTARVLSSDGWFSTGDLAYQDEGGYLFHVDRAKDMVVTGGENVYSTADLVEHCKKVIAGYKVPKGVTLTNEPLPKSDAGKILKREIRQPYWTNGSFVAGAQ